MHLSHDAQASHRATGRTRQFALCGMIPRGDVHVACDGDGEGEVGLMCRLRSSEDEDTWAYGTIYSGSVHLHDSLCVLTHLQ